MQKNLRLLKNLKFFTGLENYEESNSVPEDKFYYVNNGRFEFKVISSKKGYHAVGNLLVGGTKFQGIYEIPFWNGSATVNTLIGFYNKSFYKFNETTQLWDIIATAWPYVADNFTDGIIFGNTLYVINPLDIPDVGVTNISVLKNGTGYTSLPTIVISGGGGSGATAVPILGYGGIASIQMTNIGTGYTSATVAISDPTGTGATADANLTSLGSIAFVNVTAAGSGYSSSPAVAINDPTGIGAVVEADISAGMVTGFNIISRGVGYVSPTIVISGGGGSGATATVDLTQGIASITITNKGTNYSDPTVIISGDGTGATATANTEGGFIANVTVTAPGTGYLNTPTVTVSGGGGSGAQLIATIFTSDGIGKITNNNEFSVVHGSVGTPRGIMMVLWLERLFVAGDKAAPNAWIASKPGLATNPLAVENFDTTDGAITDLLGENGVITAMRVLNNDLYIFKNDSIYFNTRTNFANGQTQFILLSRTGGATNQKSTIVVENDIWFYDSVNNQVRSLGSERNFTLDPRTKALTEIIKRSMALLDPVQDNPVMVYNKRVVKLSLKTLGSPTNNFRIIFDYNTGGFSIDIGQGVNVNTIYNGAVFYGEDASGQAFKDDSGYNANGAAYPFEARTPFMDDGRPDTFKRARYIYFKGKLSYDQDTTIRLYRDGDYTFYSDYYIPSPHAAGISQANIVNDGQWGSSQQGNAMWGGSGQNQSDIQVYKIEKLISVNRISNLFAIGIISTINGGKVVGEQLELKVVDENENYKRSNI